MARKAAAPVLPLILVAAVLALCCAAAAWPGIAAYDATVQFRQAVGGHYDDWHPPVMARLWSLFLAAGLWGTAPMLLLQLMLYWSGLAMLAVALARAGARRAAWCALLAGLAPTVLGWMLVVDKDAQLIGALVAATGLVALFRLSGRAVAWWALPPLALLVVYALLLRANAVFAVMPLALAWAGWLGLRRWWARALLLLGATGLCLAVSGPVNHRLMRAAPSGVQYTLPLFDMAGIASRARLATMPGLPPADWAQAGQRHCYTPFYWDPFGDPARCGPIGDRLVADDDGPPPVMRNWIAAVVAHPRAYAAHRLAHLNATLRVRTPADERSAAAPWRTGENLYGIGSRGNGVTRMLNEATLALNRGPAGSPAVWALAALLLGWVLAGAPRQPARDLALTLLFSALLLTASFAVVSIASDLRYHLWPFAATALAAVLAGGCRQLPPGRMAAATGIMVAVCFASVLLRAGAPPIGY